jgi:membrane protease YdiL (CAAX protease family)
MDTTPREVAAQERPPLGPVVAWSFLALLQVGSGFLAFAMRDEGEDTNPLFRTDFVVTSLILYGILVALTLAIAAASSLDFRQVLGFRPFELRWLGVAAGVIVASFVVGTVMNLFSNAAEEQGLAPDRWEPGKEAVFAAAAVVVVLVVPFAEELFFRGLGVGLLSFAGQAVAVAVPAVAFALAHGIPVALPTLVVLGGGLAWIRYRSASVWPCFLAHATWNGLALAVAAATSF